MKRSENVFIERALPVPGVIRGEIGLEVKPFDHIGECTVSHRLVALPRDFQPHFARVSKKFFYEGGILGKSEVGQVKAPFNGYLSKKSEGGGYIFREVEGKHPLLAGVWGVIEKVKKGNSVLIRTATVDISILVATKESFAGEFVVFPNPSETLKKHYLEGFSPTATGRVVYVGDYASLELVQKAYQLGVGCLLAGSANKTTMAYAKAHKMCLGLLSGFGKMVTSDDTYEMLSEVSNRFVLFQGERNVLRIPLSPEEIRKNPHKKRSAKKKVLRCVKKGLKVLVLEKPYFGYLGEVDSVRGCSIFVKFPHNPDIKESVQVMHPNILAIE